MNRLHSHKVSVQHACEGIWYGFTTQPNFLIHITCSVIVISMGIYFGITRIEWLVVIATICLGLVIEMLNTSIESVVDLATEVWKVSAKRAKDTAAGAMLVYACGSIVVAVIVFYPYLYAVL